MNVFCYTCEYDRRSAMYQIWVAKPVSNTFVISMRLTVSLTVALLPRASERAQYIYRADYEELSGVFNALMKAKQNL